MGISIVIPAFNEEKYLAQTLGVLQKEKEISEVIVVDDGSEDLTTEIARLFADQVITLGVNCGKGEALRRGFAVASGDILVCLDSDLGESAQFVRELYLPVLAGQADMSIAVLPPAHKRGGFGLVKGLARRGIRQLTGFDPTSPLSGQRAFTREAVSKISSWDGRFGIEVGMTIDIMRSGMRIMEVPVPFFHRETGRDISGFLHRGKQFMDVGKVLGRKWIWR